VRPQHRQQRLVLLPHEILPQEGAGAEEAGEVGEHRAVGKKLEPPALAGGIEHPAHELLEARESRQRIRRPSEERGELLGQEHRETDPIDASRIVERPPRRVGHLEGILDAAGVRADGHAFDRHALQRQRGAEGVEEERGILGGHDHGEPTGAGRVDIDLHGVQLARGGPRRPGDGRRGHPVHAPPRPREGLLRARLERRYRGDDTLLQGPGGVGVAQGLGFADERVDDPSPGEPGRRALGGGRPGEGVARDDGDTRRREDARDQRELGGIIEGHDRAGHAPSVERAHGGGYRSLGEKAGERGDVRADVRFREPGAVARAEPTLVLGGEGWGHGRA
jgi:hypothetical protein